nr:helix-turn-helix domain-containing protein [Kribbella shirazensis]
MVPVLATPPGQAALVIRSEALVRPLEAVFQATWDVAEAVEIAEADPVERLGRRSREVLVLLAAGLTDEAIARELGVTDRTVRRQIACLCRKLRVDCRFQLGLEVARRGWL